MSTSERPGVYTSYEVTSTLCGTGSGKAVGLAACAASGTVSEVTAITSYAGAVAAFGADCNMTKLIKVLIQNGAPKIIAVPVIVGEGTPTTAQYEAAFAVLMAESAVGYMICDSRDQAVHLALEEAIETSDSENCKYRVGIIEQSGTISDLCDSAAAINSERMALAAPAESSGTAGSVAAAVAGAAAGSSDPALPLNGAKLEGLSGLASCYTDTEINTLVQGGVTPVENVAGEISVVRAVTTRTTTVGVSDATWRELSTILIVDDVIPSVRNALRAKFSRTKNTAQTRGAIRTQVVIELEKKLAAEIIDSYKNVTAQADASDPTVCNVGFEFTVSHGLNKISLVAYITV
ncbi:MAG: phage tail sheath protein [Clostridia bacterium]|nr:phage tail sheath protein [Clostridia bacterium]